MCRNLEWDFFVIFKHRAVFQYSKLVSSLPLAFCIFRHFFNSIWGLESSRKLTTNTATKSLKVWNSSDEFIEDFVAQWTFPEEAAKLLTLAIFLPFISSRLLLKTNRKKHDFTWVPKRAEQKHSIYVAKNSVEIALFTTIKATFFDRFNWSSFSRTTKVVVSNRRIVDNTQTSH